MNARENPFLDRDGCGYDRRLVGSESGRIKRKLPTPAEAEQQAIDMAKSDSLLRKGEIVATDRGFIVFRGLSEDGVTNDFAPVQNPFPRGKE